MTGIVADLAGVALVVACVVGGLLIIRAAIRDSKRGGRNDATTAQWKPAPAGEEGASPIPTDLELVHSRMDDLANKIDADARSRQTAFQWFLFWLPALYAVTYGLVYGVVFLVTR